MTRDEALACWAILGAAMPGHQLGEEQLAIRAELIGDLDAEAARGAALGLAQSGRWMPSVAEFREAVIAPSLPTPEAVWGEILQLVADFGYPTPPCEHQCSPAAWRTIRALGGWQRVCEGDERVDRAHVLKQIAPPILDRLRRELLAGPALRPELEAASGEVVALPDFRIDRNG